MGPPIWPAPTKLTRTACSLLGGWHADGVGLDLRVLLEALDPVLAADATGLVAAERSVGTVEHTAVHADGARADATRDVERARTTVTAYADPIFTIGALGTALAVKLVNNALFAANIQLVAQAEQIANELGVDTTTLAGVIQQSSGSSFVMGLVANMGSATALVDAAGHYMRKDIDVVRRVADELGVDLGILGEVLDGGPMTFVGR